MVKNKLREKIEYYVITLSFTVLAVAIQTSVKSLEFLSIYKFLNIKLSYVEIFSWILFLASGLFGIFKIYVISYLEGATTEKDKTLPRKKILKYENEIKLLTNIQFIIFIIGFILLIISRSLILLKCKCTLGG